MFFTSWGSERHDYRISLFYRLVVLHFVLESMLPNNAFKTDSQRIAFSGYFGFSVYVTMV
ncbi:hypothetical protein JCM18905_5007 [Vibrio sp. JCM 18905]|nr:hypothetical protein JCM18905_5007 [Vibrio sp. JCM 18905]